MFKLALFHRINNKRCIEIQNQIGISFNLPTSHFLFYFHVLLKTHFNRYSVHTLREVIIMLFYVVCLCLKVPKQQTDTHTKYECLSGQVNNLLPFCDSCDNFDVRHQQLQDGLITIIVNQSPKKTK